MSLPSLDEHMSSVWSNSLVLSKFKYGQSCGANADIIHYSLSLSP